MDRPMRAGPCSRPDCARCRRSARESARNIALRLYRSGNNEPTESQG
jgi:hypothetical protein